MASSLLLERFTHLPESVIAGFTDLQDSLKTKAKYDMNSFKELFKDPKKAWAENKAYWIKLGIRTTTIIGVAFAGWACSFAENRDKPVDIQPITKPQIGLITDSGGDSILESQLAIVQMQSGLNNCRPMIIPADSGIPGLAETVGLCSIKEPEESTRIVMRKAKNGKTEVINVPLMAKSGNEIGYKKIGGEWVTIIKINGDESKWVFPDGREMTIKLDVIEAPEWKMMLGNILVPVINTLNNEQTPTSVSTETSTSTPTLAPTPSKTPTFAPSLTPIPATIGATVVKPTPIQATATPKSVEGVPFSEGGINGLRSNTPLPNKEPRFPNSFRAGDCRVNPACDNVGLQFASLDAAESYWRSKYPNAVLKYEYWLFADGGVSKVIVELVSVGK